VLVPSPTATASLLGRPLFSTNLRWLVDGGCSLASLLSCTLSLFFLWSNTCVGPFQRLSLSGCRICLGVMGHLTSCTATAFGALVGVAWRGAFAGFVRLGYGCGWLGCLCLCFFWLQWCSEVELRPVCPSAHAALGGGAAMHVSSRLSVRLAVGD